MWRLRFSMLGLMVLVSLCAVGMAAMRTHSPWVASGLFTLAVGFVPFAALIAVVRPGRLRGPAAGFALFAGASLVLSFGVEGLRVVEPPPLLLRPALEAIERPLLKRESSFQRPGSPSVPLDSQLEYLEFRNLVGLNPTYYSDYFSHQHESIKLLEEIRGSTRFLEEIKDVRRKLYTLTALLFGFLGAGLGVLFGPPSARRSQPASEES